MKYKAVIFDLDGTLLDTLKDISTCANLALERIGKPSLPLNDYRFLVGEGARKLMERALGEDTSRCDEALELFKEFYAKGWDATTKPYDGILQMLKEMEDFGLSLGVLSNKPDLFTKECVDRYFPSISFLHVAGERDGIERKPSPAGAFIALESLHVKSDEVCFVGDTKTDMQTAKAANIDAFGVAWGFRDRKELFEYGALEVFENPEALRVHILSQARIN